MHDVQHRRRLLLVRIRQGRYAAILRPSPRQNGNAPAHPAGVSPRKVASMSKPTDPTIKTLVEITPQDWLRLTRRKLAPIRIIDADVATIRGAADKVIRVE